MKLIPKVPASITQIPITTMSWGDVVKLKKLVQRFMDGVRELKVATPQMDGVEVFARELWQRAYGEEQRRDLVAAEKADKGRIVWELFQPRSSTTPLKLSIFDTQRHVVRTAHRRFEEGARWQSGPGEWRVDESDPIEDLKREWARKPLDLVAFNQYAAEVDECIRRKRERDGTLEILPKEAQVAR